MVFEGDNDCCCCCCYWDFKVKMKWKMKMFMTLYHVNVYNLKKMNFEQEKNHEGVYDFLLLGFVGI